jgi:hypothetical protein
LNYIHFCFIIVKIAGQARWTKQENRKGSATEGFGEGISSFFEKRAPPLLAFGTLVAIDIVK